MTQATTATTTRDARTAQTAALLALATAVSALFYYKWSASLRVWGGVQANGRLSINPAILASGSRLAATLTYFGKIWPALTYGIVIGAIVRAALPPTWIARGLGQRGWRGALVGGAVGAPLMLCSCCVTPVFTGLYERGARLTSALAVMLGAPGLNIAALILTFALLPAKLAATRVIAAAIVVLGLPVLLGRIDDGRNPRAACSVEEAAAPRAFLERYMEVGRTNPETLWLGVRIERGLGNNAQAQHYAQRLKSEYPSAAQTKELLESERNPG